MLRILQNPITPLCSFIVTVLCFALGDDFLGGLLDAWHPSAKYWLFGPASLCVICGWRRYVKSSRDFQILIGEAAEGRFYGVSKHQQVQTAAAASACASVALCMGFSTILVSVSACLGAATPLGLAVASAASTCVSLVAVLALAADQDLALGPALPT